MATVYIAEYNGVRGIDSSGGAVAMAQTPPVVEQTVAIGATSVQSNAFNVNTRFIRVHVDAICSVVIGGTNPTATATNSRLAANQTEYYGINPGDKLAVITNT